MHPDRSPFRPFEKIRASIAYAFITTGLMTASTMAGAQVCGNHVRETGEQCDDGNTANLDGCSSTCSFEQVQRINYFKMQSATDGYCTNNAFGGAFQLAAGTVQTSIDSAVADGSQSILMAFLGLDDLSGATDANLQIGLLDAAPQSPTATYNGSSDLDWWYTADPLAIDGTRNPVEVLPASIAGTIVNAGPGRISLGITLGAPALLSVSSARMRASTGSSSTPTPYLYGSGNARGHLPGENLDASLLSFESMGQQSNSGAGEMCGNISAYSLSAVAVPPTLAAGGATACDQHYSATLNSMLDVFVGGCTYLNFFSLLTPTQPDQIDSGAPVAGAGGPYNLAENAQHQVTVCKDKNNSTVTLSTCLAAAAYSSFFKFTTDRVIVTDADPILSDTIFKDGFGD